MLPSARMLKFNDKIVDAVTPYGSLHFLAKLKTKYRYKQLNKQSKNIVLNSVLKLLDKWSLTEEEKQNVLGFELNNTPQTLSPEHELRLSILLDIHANLRQLFSNPTNVYGYMTMVNHNAPFNGSRPIDLACESFEGLHSVRDAIKSINTL